MFCTKFSSPLCSFPLLATATLLRPTYLLKTTPSVYIFSTNMSYPAPNGPTFSPQPAGNTNNPAPSPSSITKQESCIGPTTTLQSPLSTDSHSVEKPSHVNTDALHPMAITQEENINTNSEKQGIQMRQLPRNNYEHATPLASLQLLPAPVDCPVCGVREMTNTQFVNGSVTQ
jgi:hypothetical protein